jgi:hypothetical protein
MAELRSVDPRTLQSNAGQPKHGLLPKSVPSYREGSETPPPRHLPHHPG